MALRHQFARPMMGAATWLYDDNSGGMTSHEPQKLAARQLLAKQHLARHRCAVELENIFCQINPDHCIFHYRPLRCVTSKDHNSGTLRCRLGRAATPSCSDPFLPQ